MSYAWVSPMLMWLISVNLILPQDISDGSFDLKSLVRNLAGGPRVLINLNRLWLCLRNLVRNVQLRLHWCIHKGGCV